MKKKKQNPLVQGIVFAAILFAISLVGISFVKKMPETVYSQNALSASDLTGFYDPLHPDGVFYGNTYVAKELPDAVYATAPTDTQVLGATDHKRIEVDLTNQRLYTFEGDRKVHDFLISSGKWGRTPTCTAEENCRIWIKLRYTRMQGGSKALGTYYNLPNVPYTMFFGGKNIPAHRGFGIHGTYWHNNFGHPMSHGCINMKTEEVAQVYEWAHPTGSAGTIKATKENPGTQIIIYGKAPPS